MRTWLTALTLGLTLTLGSFAQEGVGAPDTLVRQVPQSRQEVLLSYAPLVADAAPAVVNIYSNKLVSARESRMAQMLREFFGQERTEAPQRVLSSLGSGVILREDGVIVTNNHVIQGADSITVALSDRREFEAEVVLADPRTDLAVLRIDVAGESLPTLDYADSDAVQVGDIVLAVGNPFGLSQTVTSGIVSATARTRVGVSDLSFFIQTDAAINPGNSGGALIDLKGDLVGVNTAIFSRTGQSSGLGFAIPAVMVRAVVSAALNEGQIVRPWLGLVGQAVTSALADSLGLDRPGGVLIDRLYPNGPADRAGLRPGDVVLEVNGREVLDEAALAYRVATAEPEMAAVVTVSRDGEIRDFDVALSLPPEVPPRNVTRLQGRHPFQEVTVANLSPRFNEELGLDPLMEGVVVLKVARRSPAGRLQWLRSGDIIRAADEEFVYSVTELQEVLAQNGPELPFVYRIERDGRTLDCLIANGGRTSGCQLRR